MSFTKDLTTQNHEFGATDSSYTLQAPLALSKIKKWSYRLPHFPKGIGAKIQGFMSELEHNDCIALFDVLLDGIHDWECHWQALMPIWNHHGKWREMLDAHGWALFDQNPTCEVTYYFSVDNAQLLLEAGLIVAYYPTDTDALVSTTLEQDWDTFSQWFHGFHLAHEGQLVFVKPESHQNDYWCPHAAPSMTPEQPKSNPKQ